MKLNDKKQKGNDEPKKTPSFPDPDDTPSERIIIPLKDNPKNKTKL